MYYSCLKNGKNRRFLNDANYKPVNRYSREKSNFFEYITSIETIKIANENFDNTM
jgi:hypothetical protein